MSALSDASGRLADHEVCLGCGLTLEFPLDGELSDPSGLWVGEGLCEHCAASGPAKLAASVRGFGLPMTAVG